MNEPMNESINEIKDLQEKFNLAIQTSAENSEDVKNGICTANDEVNEPGNVLFNQIVENTVKILGDPEVKKAFVTIAKGIGSETTKALLDIISITMSYSAFQAITFYDDLLKRELTKQFDNVGNHINISKADIEAHKSVLQMFKKQIGDINNKLQIDEIKDNYPGDLDEYCE